MKKNIKRIYLLELLILVFVIVFKFILMGHSGYIGLFWLFFMILLIIMGGFPKDSNYLKKSTIRTVIISMLLYFIIIYILGMFTGYSNGFSFDSTWKYIKVVSLLILSVVCGEISRYLLFKRNPNKLQIVIFTVLMISLNMVTIINANSFSSFEMAFLVVSVIILPVVAREFLYSYMTYKISFVPSLIMKLIISIYAYILPIVPNLGNYITAIVGIFLPYMIYNQVNKSILYSEKYSVYARKYLKRFCFFLVIVFGIGLTILVSGIFKYQMIAIVSGSMEPVYYRGDAVILEKKDASDIKKGDILVFKYSENIITHRVIDIKKNGNHYVFTTKGDNNASNDAFKATDEDVIGVVRYIVKYIGMPTVWFNEQ